MGDGERHGPPGSDQPTEALPAADDAPASAKPVRPPPPPTVPNLSDLAPDPTSELPVAEVEAHPPDPARSTEAAVELPPLEEITFEPTRPATTPADEPTVAIPTAPPEPAVRPTTLSRRRFATLAAFAEAMLPPGGPIEYSASDARVAERLDVALGAFDRRARRLVERALTVIEWSPLFSRHTPRRFSRLALDARVRVCERALRSRSPVLKGSAELLKFMSVNQWASSPAVERALGFTYSCESAEPPRQGERLEVLSWPQVSRDHEEECDIVVVGSGAGGAVVAKELAESGMSVVLVEEGGSYNREDFTGPPFERFLKLYRSNGTTFAAGRPTIALPLGLAVGGSTVVNSGTCFRTPDRVLQRWERDMGLPGVDPASMKPYFDRVERIQRVKPVPEDVIGQNARVFRRGVERLGLNGAPIARAIEGCRGCGVCAFGCPSDAKLATHLTYLPRAQRHGTTIYANARAERIVVEDGRARGLEAALLDPRTREPKARLTVRAKVVILCAGAIHTPALLARNALGGRSGQLGRNLRIHPAAGVGAIFDEEVVGWRGTLQSYYVDDFHESHDIMIEVTASVPSVGAGTFPGAGPPLKELLARYPHVASAGLFVSDTSTGRVIPRASGEPFVTYRLNTPDRTRMVRGIEKVAEIFLAAGARAVLTGLPGVAPVTSKADLDAIKEEAIAPGALRLTAFHPVGTARMGPDPTTSVVDPWGEVHGVGGLFVADASVLPGCPTVNPQVTIMAFATRTADHLVRHAARYV